MAEERSDKQCEHVDEQRNLPCREIIHNPSYWGPYCHHHAQGMLPDGHGGVVETCQQTVGGSRCSRQYMHYGFEFTDTLSRKTCRECRERIAEEARRNRPSTAAQIEFDMAFEARVDEMEYIFKVRGVYGFASRVKKDDLEREKIAKKWADAIPSKVPTREPKGGRTCAWSIMYEEPPHPIDGPADNHWVVVVMTEALGKSGRSFIAHR